MSATTDGAGCGPGFPDCGLSKLLTASPLAVIAMDAEGHVTAWNAAAEHMFGWTTAEALGAVAPHSAGGLEHDRLRLRRKLQTEGRFAGLETQRARKDGRLIDVAISAAALTGPDGSYAGSICLIEDITSRRRVEAQRAQAAAQGRSFSAALAEVAASEALSRGDWREVAELIVRRVRDCMGVARAGIWRITADDEAIELDSFCHADGPGLAIGTQLGLASIPAYAAALRSGRTIAADDAVRDERTAELAAGYLAPLGIGALLDSPIRIGSRVQGVLCLEHVGPSREWSAEEQAFAASMADLAALAIESGERHRTLARLEAALARAEAAGRAKSQFLANMGHELRTPLNAVIGFADLLADTLTDSAAARSHAQDIADAGRHLLSVINDVLALTQAEHGVMRLTETSLTLSALAMDAVRLVRHMAEARGVDIRVQVPPMVGLKGDAAKLRQALLNLLSNAVKFSAAGTAVTVTASVGADGAIRIAVRDQGCGMDAADIPRAFEPFVQLSSGRSRLHEGAGLGLPLSRGLVELHGGTLELHSAPGRGTVACMTLPAARVMAPAAVLAA
jgi:PAS domain S-box-containing protein